MQNRCVVSKVQKKRKAARPQPTTPTIFLSRRRDISHALHPPIGVVVVDVNPRTDSNGLSNAVHKDSEILNGGGRRAWPAVLDSWTAPSHAGFRKYTTGIFPVEHHGVRLCFQMHIGWFAPFRSCSSSIVSVTMFLEHARECGAP